MKTTAFAPMTRWKPARWRQVTGQHNALPPPGGGTVSRLRRWLRAVLPAPALISPRPKTPVDRTPDASSPASIDLRELSSWRPFSPRF